MFEIKSSLLGEAISALISITVEILWFMDVAFSINRQRETWASRHRLAFLFATQEPLCSILLELNEISECLLVRVEGTPVQSMLIPFRDLSIKFSLEGWLTAIACIGLCSSVKGLRSIAIMSSIWFTQIPLFSLFANLFVVWANSFTMEIIKDIDTTITLPNLEVIDVYFSRRFTFWTFLFFFLYTQWIYSLTSVL